MFQGGCGLANCCKNKQSGEAQLVTPWDEVIKPYDATQEAIFPPELQVIESSVLLPLNMLFSSLLKLFLFYCQKYLLFEFE